MAEYRYTISIDNKDVIARDVPRSYLSTLINALLDDLRLDFGYAITIKKYRLDDTDGDLSKRGKDNG